MYRLARHATPVAAVAALGLALTGCSSGGGQSDAESSSSDWSIPTSDPTATIQVLSILSLDSDGMQDVVDAFEKDHPSITLEWETVPFSDLNSVVDSRVSQKNGSVDVYWADQPRIASLASRGYLEDLTGPFEASSETWDTTSKDASSYDGKLWAVPIATSSQLLFYNKDLLDAAGVEAPSADPAQRITWEQLSSDAAKVQKDGGAKWGFMFGQFDRYYQIQPLLMEMGGSTGVTGDDGLTGDVTSDAWVQALDWYKSIFDDGIAPRGEEEMQDEFIAGNTAYIEQGTWLIDSLADVPFNWGVAANPTFEGKDAVTPTGSWSLGMSPYSDQKEASAIFMDWMSSTDGGQYSVYRPSPELPATQEGRDTYFARDVFATEAGKDAKNIIDYELANTAVPRPSTIGYVEFEEVLNRAFADVRNGTDPKSALDNAATQLDSAWAVYK
ncbi:ABC transporter substrate-binding protein [Schaalia naturae]|uniref:ABC transporter substrate-binding protein n=1 Tax=Schaalia naturae TaxID=635203 RepID=A0ABW2SJU8_9ACTO